MIPMSSKIPFIHFNNLASASELKLLDNACREWGFFYLNNHGIEPSLLQGLESEMREFFQLSQVEKKKIERTRKNPWGYYDRELISHLAPSSTIAPSGRHITTVSSRLQKQPIVVLKK
jgi:isopenicillin N synthase-like dioxygenase